MEAIAHEPLSLIAWRKARGVSQGEMADLCSVHINTYRAWEQSPGEIRLDKALLIAKRLGITVDDIIISVDTTKGNSEGET
jgi:transcriptional regulator with XRE-family HTH domain